MIVFSYKELEIRKDGLDFQVLSLNDKILSYFFKSSGFNA